MPDSTKAGLRCPICGETAPEPAWICLHRTAGIARPGDECSFSVEGNARAVDGLDRAAGIPVNEVGGER